MEDKDRYSKCPLMSPFQEGRIFPITLQGLRLRLHDESKQDLYINAYEELLGPWQSQ